jgi:hypothetical protein
VSQLLQQYQQSGINDEDASSYYRYQLGEDLDLEEEVEEVDFD